MVHRSPVSQFQVVDSEGRDAHNRDMDKLLTNAEIAALETTHPALIADATTVLWGINAGVRMAARRRLTATVRG